MAEGWHGLEEQADGTFVFACSDPLCYYRVLSNGKGDEHKCPHRGKTTNGWSITVGLVEQIWKYLDDCIDIIKDPQRAALSGEWAKAQARAYAKSLALFTKPIFNDEDEVAKEGMKRWRARQAGDDSYETKGWLHATFVTLKDAEDIEAQRQAEEKPERPTPAPAAPSHKLSPKDVQGVVNGMQSGFSEEQVAGLYKITPAQVREIVKSFSV